MSITEKNITYEDYKFVLQDTLNNVVSIGAKFSYEELLAIKEQLRVEKLIMGAINNMRNGLIAPISIVEMLN